MIESSIPSNKQESQTLKKCNKCGETKLISEFYKDVNGIDGHRCKCKSCSIAYRKSHYIENRDAIIEKAIAKYYRNKDEISKRKKKYYKENSSKIIKLRHIYYEENKDIILDKNKEYRRLHRDEILAIEKINRQKRCDEIIKYQREYRKTEAWRVSKQKSSHKRRAQKNGVYCEDFKPTDILNRDGYRCQLCGRKTRPDYNTLHLLFPHLDHIVPLSKGGLHTRKNTQCLCRQCNLMKNNTGTGDQFRMF